MIAYVCIQIFVAMRFISILGISLSVCFGIVNGDEIFDSHKFWASVSFGQLVVGCCCCCLFVVETIIVCFWMILANFVFKMKIIARIDRLGPVYISNDKPSKCTINYWLSHGKGWLPNTVCALCVSLTFSICLLLRTIHRCAEKTKRTHTKSVQPHQKYRLNTWLWIYR